MVEHGGGRDGEDADAQAIEEVLTRLSEGFARRDARRLAGLYAPDADWTNAFGTTLKGEDVILAYLERLFAEPRFRAGRMSGAPSVEVRPVADGVVVAKTYLEIEDQETATGAIPLRRNFSMKVLAREPDGRWLIVSDMYMDARDETTLDAPA